MANKVGGNVKVTAWEGKVTVFENGAIKGEGKCWELKPGNVKRELTSSEIPKGASAVGSGKVVVLGVSGAGKVLDFTVMDLPKALNHVKFRDLSIARNRGIGGCHDAVEFAKVRQLNAVGNTNYQVAVGKTLDEVEEIVIVGTRNSTTPGVKIVEYKIPAIDSKLKTTGGLKGDGANAYTKTTYDPAIWSGTKLEKALKEALQDASNKNNGILIREWEGLTSEGYKMRGYFENGKVTSFFFD